MSLQIKFSELKDKDIVMLLSCNDYFRGEGGPSVTTMTLQEFIKDVLSESMEENDITASEAFNGFTSASGDGGENYYLILIRHGKGYAVIGEDME